jgi:hypothetical protein
MERKTRLTLSRDHVHQALEEYARSWLQHTAELITYKFNKDGTIDLHVNRSPERKDHK